MKLYEFEGKKILRRFGVKTPNPLSLTDLTNGKYFIKAQVLSGGREKAGGVKTAANFDEAKTVINEMLGKKIITPQNPAGEIIKTALIEEKISVEKELYLSFMIDRNNGYPVLIASSCGGTDIEEINTTFPEKIFKTAINPLLGLQEFQIMAAANSMDVGKDEYGEFSKTCKLIFETFVKMDAMLLEINPLALTSEKNFICLDCKMTIDDYALFRQPELQSIKKFRETNASKNQLMKEGLNYIAVSEKEGVGMFSNGAGLMLDTFDCINNIGAKIRSGIDLGGAVTVEQIKLLLEFMENDPKIKIIFGNIYTAMTGAEKIAAAIIELTKIINQAKPIIVRLEGNEAKESIKSLKTRNIPNLYAYRTTEAALECLKSIYHNKPITAAASDKKYLNNSPIPKCSSKKINICGITLDRNLKLIIQGMGKEGKRYAKKLQEFGMKISAGISPGKGGQNFEGIPIFNTIEQAKKIIDQPDATIIFVPPQSAKNAILEAAYNNIKIINCITEGIPVHDVCLIKSHLKSTPSILIGPNCPGIISPEKCDISIHPYKQYRKGEIAIISRSGSLSYEMSTRLIRVGIGTSLILGIGGDPVPGMTFAEALELIKNNKLIKGVIIIGEIGGQLENKAADYMLKTNYPKPVMLYIAGLTAPKEKRMGHAGALIESSGETAKAKTEYWKEKNLPVCNSLLEIGETAKNLLKLKKE